MIDPDFSRILQCAKLSSLIYETDEAALASGVRALGLGFVGFAGNDQCQAMVVGNPAGQIVVIRGTQVTENLSLAELWDDADPGHTDLGNGALVRSGAWDALQELWDDRLGGMVYPDLPLTITGHSLGAQRAVMFPWLLDPAQQAKVVGFAPPKAGNAAFYQQAYAGRPAPLVIGRENDFALSWSPLDSVAEQPPGDILHLVGGRWEWLSLWPAGASSISDHDVDLYVADIAKQIGVTP